MSDEQLNGEELEEMQELVDRVEAALPINPQNEFIQPVPTGVIGGVLGSTQGPVGALTFRHPAGEYTFMTQDPQEFDKLIAQAEEVKQDLVTANLRHALTNPSSGIVVPTPKVPGANGAMLLG
jgi:hypothetical protein